MHSRMLIIGTVLIFSVCMDSVVGQRLNAPKPITSQELLPSSTKAWFSIPDATKLDKKFLETQIGQLAKNKQLAPFVESIKSQFKNWMNDKNVRLGLKLEDVQGVRSGEICIAGILPNQAPGKAQGAAADAHGLVLLVDVSGNLDAANKLMKKLSADLTARGATKEKFSDAIDAEVSKWKFPSESRIKKPKHAYQTITGGWLLSSDNEAIFRRILRKLVNIDGAKGQSLAAHPAFQGVMNKVKLEGIEPEVFWYVNPFGYIQLAQAIARERQKFNQKNSDDWAKILKKIGFDGFQGIGGYLAFATGDHELLHRTFVFRPDDPNQNIKQKRVYGMLDFRNAKNSQLTPPAFVADSASGYFCASWNMQRALKNVGHAIDTFAKKDGTFRDTLESLRREMQVDVPKVFDNFDNEMMVIADSTMPIKRDSERLVIAVRLKGNSKFVEQSIMRSYPHQHELIKFENMNIIEIDPASGADDEDLGGWEEDDPFQDPHDDVEDEEVEDPGFSLFEKKYCVTSGEYLFIANNLNYLKGVLKTANESTISKSNDYKRIAESLELMSEGTNVSFRQFSRLDRVLRPNYEMMRSGKMAASDTILARVINQLFESNKDDPQLKRKQEIDGSKLPSNYELHVAPYLGPSGWVMETLDDGWLFSGVILDRKKNSNQVVKKEDANSVHK